MPESRFLNIKEAAEYLGVGQDLFAEEVKAGMWPRPLRRGSTGRRLTWDRKLLDAQADRLAGIGATPPAPSSPSALAHAEEDGNQETQALLQRITSRNDGNTARHHGSRGRTRRA